MYAEDLLVDDGGDWKTVKAERKCFPKPDAESGLAFVVETVHTVNTGAFVVSTKHEEVFGVSDLVGEEQDGTLDTLRSTIHVVTEEQIVRSRRKESEFKHAEEIEVLAVDVADDFEWGCQGQQTGLLQKDFLGGIAQPNQFVLLKACSGSWVLVTDSKALVDDDLCSSLVSRQSIGHN